MTRNFSRRDFLSGGVGLGAAGALHSTLGPSRRRPARSSGSPAKTSPDSLGSHAPAATPHTTGATDTLVLCTLYGGNDGLNTVIPYEDHTYRQQRGPIAIPPDQALALGAVDGVPLGFHPSMVGLKQLFDAGQVAVILGVGYPDPNLSHFASQAIWQSADTSGVATSGWLGRWLDKTGTDPLRALSVGPTVPIAFAGDLEQASTLADSTNPGAQVPGGSTTFLSSYQSMERTSRNAGAVQNDIAKSGSSLLEVGTYAYNALNSHSPPPNVSKRNPGDLGQQLSIVAELMEADLPTKAYGVQSELDFDTHSNQPNIQGGNLSQVDAAVFDFVEAFQGATRNPAVVVYSEFGRRVEANASQGTDHGTASVVIVAGPKVKGGFYGTPSSLTKLDEYGNLVHTMDFRRIYATLLANILGQTPKDFLGAAYAPLEFL